jgi:hypothetical protein
LKESLALDRTIKRIIRWDNESSFVNFSKVIEQWGEVEVGEESKRGFTRSGSTLTEEVNLSVSGKRT